MLKPGLEVRISNEIFSVAIAMSRRWKNWLLHVIYCIFESFKLQARVIYMAYYEAPANWFL